MESIYFFFIESVRWICHFSHVFAQKKLILHEKMHFFIKKGGVYKSFIYICNWNRGEIRFQ